MPKSTTITVLGVLNILFGTIGILAVIFSAAAIFNPSSAQTDNPVMQIMRDSPNYVTWTKLVIPIGFLACGVSIAAGIGLLRLKKWGRVLSLGYGIYGIFMSLINLVVNYIFLTKPLLALAAHKQGVEAGAMIGGAVGSTIGGCFGLVYPILLLIFLTRSKVVAAFRPPGEPPPLN